MAIIAIDFDHTLVNGDQALPGAKRAVNLMRERGHRIVISSCNRLDWIKKTLDNLDIRYDHIYAEGSSKPVADLYVDDLAFHFKGSWDEEVGEILKRLEQ